MSYIGVSPFTNTVRTVTRITANGSANTFYPDGGYTKGYVDVFVAGEKKVDGIDFTASDSLQIQFSSSPANNDIIEIVAYRPVALNIADFSEISNKPDPKITLSGDASGNVILNDLTSNTLSLVLASSGVVANAYGNSSQLPILTVDAKGRITNATTTSIAGVTGITYTTSNSTITVATTVSDYNAVINSANGSVQGLLKIVDSVSNSSATVAASANSVKTSYELAGNAVSNAVSYAASAYSNAVAYADAKVANLVNSAPAALDTLLELAAALGNDASFSATVTTGIGNAYTNAIAYAASNTYVNNTFLPLAGGTMTGTIANGTFTTLTTSNTVTINGGTANGVAYLNGSKVLTTGSALTFDGSGAFKSSGSANGFLSSGTFVNTSNGSGAINRIQIGNDGSDGTAQIVVYGSQHSTLANVVDINQAVNAALRFLTNNTERARITGAGNFGIGTDDPSQKLHVQSASNAQGLFKTTGAGGGSNRSSVILEGPSNTWYINTNGSDLNGSDGSLGFYGNSATRMVISTTGNVGIGTDNPNASYKLDVAGKIRIAPSSGAAELAVRSPSGSSNYISWSEASVADRAAIGFANGSGNLQFRMGGYDMATGTQSMTLNSSGQLFIGSTPQAGYSNKLFILGASATAYNPSAGQYASANALRVVSGGTPTTGDTTGISLAVGGSAEAYIGIVQNSSGYGDIVFQSYSGSYAEHARINSAGNFGIGTPTPATKLELYQVTSSRNTVTDMLTLYNYSATNPYDGFGNGIVFKGLDYSNYPQSYASIVGGIDTTFRSTPQPDTGFGGVLRFFTGTNGALNERMRISSSGNVGIGTNSPVSQLTISDGAAPYAPATGEMIQLRRTPANGNNTTSFVGISLANASNGFKIGYGGTTDRLRFIDGGDIEVLSLLNGGNVGIGSTSPYSPLTVTQARRGNDPEKGALLLVTTSTTINDRLNLNFSMNGVHARARAAIGAVALDADGYDCGLAFYTRLANDGSGLLTTDEKMRITSSGQVFIGSPTLQDYATINYRGKVQISQSGNAQLACAGFYNDTSYGGEIILSKSRNNTIGGNTIVQNGDRLGTIMFAGANGTGYDFAAEIRCYLDGTPGSSGDMPGSLAFWTTPNGSATPQERIRITSAGDVGIGADPTGYSTKFFISDSRAGASAYITNGSTDATASGLKVEVSAANDSTKANWQHSTLLLTNPNYPSSGIVTKLVLNTANGGYNSGAIIHAEGAGGYNQGQLVFSTGWDINSNGTERMRIKNDGNVGIGTNNPVYKLDVNGTSMFRDTLNFGSGGNLSWTSGYSDGTTQTFSSTSSGSLALIANGSVGLFVKSNQNVGIGTTSPAYKLHVRGTDATAVFAVGNLTEDTRLEVLTYQDDKVVLRANDSSNTARNLAFELGTTEVGRFNTSGTFIVSTAGAGIQKNGSVTSLTVGTGDGFGLSTSYGVLALDSGGLGLALRMYNGGYYTPFTFGKNGVMSVGGATPTASGAGIQFPATRQDSSDANVLDDYEEGTWTPTVLNQNGTRIDSATTIGQYTKIGNRIFFNMWLVGGTLSGASTSVFITLPFPVINSNTGYAPVSIWPYSGFTYTGQIIPRTQPGTSQVLLQLTNSGSSSEITNANFSGTLNLMVGGEYIAE